MKASEVAQQVNVPTAIHDNKYFRARLHMMGGENQLLQVILWPVAYTCIYKIS